MIDQLYTEQEIKKYEKYCFKCKKTLYYHEAFVEFINKKMKEDGFRDKMPSELKLLFRDQFNVWWLSDKIQFYCCNCYNQDNNPAHLPYFFNPDTREFNAGRNEYNNVSMTGDLLATVFSAMHIFEEYYYLDLHHRCRLDIEMNSYTLIQFQIENHYDTILGLTELERVSEMPFIRKINTNNDLRENRIIFKTSNLPTPLVINDYNQWIEYDLYHNNPIGHHDDYYRYRDLTKREIEIHTGILTF